MTGRRRRSSSRTWHLLASGSIELQIFSGILGGEEGGPETASGTGIVGSDNVFSSAARGVVLWSSSMKRPKADNGAEDHSDSMRQMSLVVLMSYMNTDLVAEGSGTGEALDGRRKRKRACHGGLGRGGREAGYLLSSGIEISKRFPVGMSIICLRNTKRRFVVGGR